MSHATMNTGVSMSMSMRRHPVNTGTSNWPRAVLTKEIVQERFTSSISGRRPAYAAVVTLGLVLVLTECRLRSLLGGWLLALR